MRYLVVLLALALVVPAALGKTLQSAYEEAGPGEGYDKLVVLDPNVAYSGGCGVLNGKKSCFRGNGAVVDLNSGMIFGSEYGTELTVTGCCLIRGGVGAVYAQNGAKATIDGNTICKSGSGVRIWEYSTATIKNNIIWGNEYGIAKHQSSGSLYISYNDVDNNSRGNYMYWCPG